MNTLLETSSAAVSDTLLRTNATLIDEPSKLWLLSDFFRRKKEFCWDLETTVTDDVFDRRIRTLAFGDAQEQYIVDLLGFSTDLDRTQGWYQRHDDYAELREIIEPVLDSDQWLKVGYNLEFEYITTRWCLGIWSWNFFCCFNAEKALKCGSVSFKIKGFWALDDALARYFGIELSKDLQKSFNLTDPLAPEQVEYAALDVSLPQYLKQEQVREAIKVGLQPTFEIENNVVPAFGDQHLNGIKLDTLEWQKRITEIMERKKTALEALDAMFIPICGRKSLPECDLERMEQEWRDTIPDKNYRKTLTKEQKERYDEEVRLARAYKKAIYSENSKRINEILKQVDSCEGEALINYNSTQQLKVALLRMGIPEKELPDTSERTLSRLTKYPVVKAILEFRGIKKLEGTYGQPFFNHINPKTGRIHAHFHQIGAETGRASSTKPNLFNLPKGKEWRRGFIAEAGNKIITTDFSGQELRILTEVSREPVWVNAFKQGWDVHSVVAELVFGDTWRLAAVTDGVWEGAAIVFEKGPLAGTPYKCEYYFDNKKKCSCPKHKKLRDNVKSINFGIAYGMTENKLSDELGISRGEARHLLEKYYVAVRVLKQYLDKSGNSAKTTYKSRTICGRVRYFKKPEWNYAKNLLIDDGIEHPSYDDVSRKMWSLTASIEREGKNSVIQGTAADMLKLAMGCGRDPQGKPYLWHVLRQYGAKLVNNVYDEIVVECPEDKVNELGPIISERMCTAAGQFVKIIPFDTEQHIENFWQK